MELQELLKIGKASVLARPPGEYKIAAEELGQQKDYLLNLGESEIGNIEEVIRALWLRHAEGLILTVPMATDLTKRQRKGKIHGLEKMLVGKADVNKLAPAVRVLAEKMKEMADLESGFE